MPFKIFIKVLFFLGTLASAATLQTNKDVYNNEIIIVNFSDMQGQDHDWIGIYPKNAPNDWGNQLQWSWTEDQVAGVINFPALPAGEYEVRAFYNNSFNLEAQKEFSVEGNLATSVETSKPTYTPNEPITIQYNGMLGNEHDWMGIFPKDEPNVWGNQVAWSWTNGNIAGEKQFDPLPLGEYEIRMFFNNSFSLEAHKSFQVVADPNDNPIIESSKQSYASGEAITINFENSSQNDHDWIGIFPKDAPSVWGNQVAWSWTDGVENGQKQFDALPAGEYEVRLFFNDSFNAEANYLFAIEAPNEPIRILYDDFEDGIIDPRWVHVVGKPMLLNNFGVNDGAVGHTERHMKIAGKKSLRTYVNVVGGANSAEYYFDFQNPNPDLKFLEIDVSMTGESHFMDFGVLIKTKHGNRRIKFAAWMNHTLPSGQQIYRGPYGNVLEGHRELYLPDEGTYLHVHAGPTDYAVGTRNTPQENNNGKFIYYKLNIEERLKMVEPDNDFLGMIQFTTSGGHFDNLALSSE